MAELGCPVIRIRIFSVRLSSALSPAFNRARFGSLVGQSSSGSRGRYPLSCVAASTYRYTCIYATAYFFANLRDFRAPPWILPAGSRTAAWLLFRTLFTSPKSWSTKTNPTATWDPCAHSTTPSRSTGTGDSDNNGQRPRSRTSLHPYPRHREIYRRRRLSRL